MAQTGTLLRTRRWPAALLAAGTGLLALLLLWSGAEAIGDHVETQALGSAEERAGAIADAAGQFAARALAVARDVQALAGHWASHAGPEGAAMRNEVAGLLSEHIRNARGTIARVAVTDAAGRVQWSSAGQDGIGTSLADQPWFQAHAAEGGATTGRVRVNQGLARAEGPLPDLVIPTSVRIPAPGGGFGGVIVVALEIRSLAQALAGLAHRPGEVAAILLAEGEVLVRSQDSAPLLGRRLVTPRTLAALEDSPATTLRSLNPLTGAEVMIAVRTVPGGEMLTLGSVELGAGLAAAARVRLWSRIAALLAWTVMMALVAATFLIVRAREERRDFTAQQQGRAEIERLLAGLPAIVFLREVGPDGIARHVYRNGDGAAVSGWPVDALPKGKPWAEFADPEADFDGLYQRTLAEGQAMLDWRMRQPDGSWAWMRTTMRLLERQPNGHGSVVGYIVNITAERAAEARARAASRLASLGEMGQGLAHELRQPLTAISLAVGVAVMAAKRGDMDRVMQRLDRILDQVKRGSAIIDYLRRFARGGEEADAVAPVNLAQALEGALTLAGGALAEAEAEVLVTLGPPPPVVLGRAVPIEQVLVALLFNARDALEALPPGAARRVAVTSTVEDGIARLAISDTGGGIPAAVMGRIFEPFVTTKGPDRGAGLGLSTCHGLMRSMGGGITAENTGIGARFTLSLPLVPEGMADGAAAHATAEAAPPGGR